MREENPLGGGPTKGEEQVREQAPSSGSPPGSLHMLLEGG